jgi:signal transduction histidine kinase
LLVEIYPPELHRAGLAAALADLLGTAGGRGLETSLGVDPELRLEPDTEALIFRVAQEAVRNAVKHAGAESLHVRAEAGATSTRLIVEDDGRGFDADSAGGEGHFGLRMLKDMVRAAGGELEIESSPGKGTRVMVEVPA